MHVVQCPLCRRKFKVPAPVTEARMKCSRCGQAFIGSTVEEIGAPIPLAPSNVDGPAPALRSTEPKPRQMRRTTSSTSVILLIVGIFGILGIAAMAIIIHYRLTHPTVIVRDAKTGRIIEQEKTTLEEAGRKIARHRAEAGGSAPPKHSPGENQTIKGDPKLQTGWEIVKTDGVEKMYVCGSVLNMYAVARKQITVTVYINGVRGLSRTYQFVPPEGVIHFSIRLGGRKADENNIKVIATGEPVDADTIIWTIDASRMNSDDQNDKVVWSGRTRNRSSVPVKDVKIYCDFFDDEGVQGNDKPVIGELVSARTIGSGKSANFRVEFDAVGASVYDTVVARAVGRKY